LTVGESQTGLDHEPDVGEGERFWVSASVAGIVALALMALHWWQVSSSDSIERAAGQLGGEVPAASAVLFNLNRLGVTPVLVLVVDTVIFVVMLALARRYWIGLLVVPAILYLGMSAAYYLTMVAPLLTSITLVK
jgi:uncharacterized membrane protein